MDHPLFEIVTTTLGVKSIRNKRVNEIMHNPVGPWAEANALYILQSKLAERLSQSGPELVLFDVGLGAAANALAALHSGRGAPRALRIVSFEREMELLRYALKHADQFPHFEPFMGAVAELLASGSWSEGNLSWELREGNFREKILEETRKPDLIYFDPYSSKVNREMWAVDCFKALRRVSRDEGTLLYTYSQATPVRVAILAGGFYLGRGPASGPKEETTIAATRLSDLENPMGAEWFGRWQRSHIQVPYECKEVERAENMRKFVRNHPQFISPRP